MTKKTVYEIHLQEVMISDEKYFFIILIKYLKRLGDL